VISNLKFHCNLGMVAVENFIYYIFSMLIKWCCKCSLCPNAFCGMTRRFNFYSFPGYEFLISTIVFSSLVKYHHRLPFKTNCWYQEFISY